MSSRRTSLGRLARRDERGQAMVEFALIAPLFLMIVVGVIQFGIAINYWFDMQRLANQGARWAVVNAYPGCPRSGPQSVCAAPAGVTYVDGSAIPDLLHYDLANDRIAAGEDIKPYICFPANTGAGGTPAIGDAVTVRMTRTFGFNAILGTIGSIDLHSSATMRIEDAAESGGTLRYTSDGAC